MSHFWTDVKKKAQKEKRPIVVLAPMADVTDAAFRQMIAKKSRMGEPLGGPDVMWTEFVSADGLCSAGQPKLLPDLVFENKEKPIVAQLFSSKPEKMEQAAALCKSLGFDGIDINMGCPDKSIEKSGAGAALIKNAKLAGEIIEAARRGASGGGASTSLPISVKTRLGYNKNEMKTWLPELLKHNLAALTVHLRTRKEMSKVAAHWQLMPEIVAMRDALAPETILLGNGDVSALTGPGGAVEKWQDGGCDGVMIGRGIFGNPWFFDWKLSPSLHSNSASVNGPSLKNKLEALVEHTYLFEKLVGHKSFAIMKKHFKAYVHGFDGAQALRAQLMEAENGSEVEKVVEKVINNLP